MAGSTAFIGLYLDYLLRAMQHNTAVMSHQTDFIEPVAGLY